MKVFALIQRLVRDLTQTNPSNLTAEERQTIQDCINASLQRMHDYAPDHSKITEISLILAAPRSVTLGVTENSQIFTAYTATDADMYCTVRIDGDSIDNQIIGNDTLLIPYSGSTGTVSATIYCDAVALPAEYSSIASNPRYANTHTELTQGLVPSHGKMYQNFATGNPDSWTAESNAQHDDYRAIFRVNRLPLETIRLRATARMSPPRVSFLETLTAIKDLPIRYEHVESYLMPMVRGMLSETDLWRNQSTKVAASKRGEEAEIRYERMIPQTITTPANIVGTPIGY